MAIYRLQESGYKKALPRLMATSAVVYAGIIAYLTYLSFTKEVTTTKWMILSSGTIVLAVLIWSMVSMIRYRHLLARSLRLSMFICPIFILGTSYRLLHTEEA